MAVSATILGNCFYNKHGAASAATRTASVAKTISLFNTLCIIMNLQLYAILSTLVIGTATALRVVGLSLGAV